MPKEKTTLGQVLPAPKENKAEKNPRKRAENEKEDKTFLHLLRLLIISGIIIVAGLIFVAWGTYSEGWQNYLVDSVSKIVPFPAASVGYGNWVTLKEYNRNIKAMRHFLESKEAAYGGGNFDFSTPEGIKRLAIIKKNILNQLLEGKLTEVIAKEQGISVSNRELSDTAEKIISRDGKQSENSAQLNALYGWSTDDFRDGVIKNLLYQQKLEDKIKANGELDKDAKEKLAMVQSELSAGQDFAAVAKEHSDSPSKQFGGLLPAFSREEAPQVLSDAAFNLNTGQISQPVEADDGWHIIKLEKKFPASPAGGSEAGKEKVQVSHIVIQKMTFKDWLQQKKGKSKIMVFLKPYYWHEQMGKLYFQDDSLNQLEQDMNRIYLNEKNQETDFLLNTTK